MDKTGVDLLLSDLLTNYGLLGLLLIVMSVFIWFMHSLYLKSEKNLMAERANSHAREKEINASKVEEIKALSGYQHVIEVLIATVKGKLNDVG